MACLSGTGPGLGEEALWDGAERGRVRPVNQKRSFEEAEAHFHRMYFSPNCVYDEKDFERSFRIPRVVFARV